MSSAVNEYTDARAHALRGSTPVSAAPTSLFLSTDTLTSSQAGSKRQNA